VILEIWSDVVCPWCYIGKRRLETALQRFEHTDSVEVVHRSFELNPAAPREASQTLTAMLAQKYRVSETDATAMNARVTTMAKTVGLDYRLELARPSNSFDAHRMIHLASEVGGSADMVERLFAAYFIEGRSISDRETLIEIGAGVGIPEATAAEVLDGNRLVEEVREDETLASSLGIASVPFFVMDRSFGLAGAHEPDTLLKALHQAWAQRDQPIKPET
jgi:predicted DsbA family dithiol-disulfide isomerase